MTNLHRRTALLLSAAGSLLGSGSRAADAPRPPDAQPDHAMGPLPPGWVRADQIAMLVYPKMTALDLVGPHYMFTALFGAKVHLVAKSLDPVTSDAGLLITPSTTFADCPRDLTVLFTPGGTTGTLVAARDDETRAFMADRGSRAAFVTSVCTGSLILGAAGLLKGYRATSHWAARDLLAEFGATPVDERVVRDRNRITGAGVTAGLDLGLMMVAELRDRNYAECTQLCAEYDPRPPFSAGSVHTAPPDVVQSMSAMFGGFQQHVRELALSLKG